MKNFIKKLIPNFLLSLYHWKLAYLGALLYGFPSRKLTVIGVTGTKGKTTTCNLIAQILQGAGLKTGMATTVNFMIGDKEWINEYKQTMLGRFRLQKLLRQMVREGCKYAVIETSSEGISQHRHKFIDYSVAVFTNLTPEHIERHGSFEKYREAKLKLFEVVSRRKDGVGIYNLDDQNAEYFLKIPIVNKVGFTTKNNSPHPPLNIRGGGNAGENPPHPPFIKGGRRESAFIKGGRGEESLKKEGDSSLSQREGSPPASPCEAWRAGRDFEKFQISSIKLFSNKTEFDFNGDGFEMPLIGEFNVYNAVAAICVALSQGIETEKIKEILKTAKPTPGRLEVVDCGQPFTVIVDYAHEPASLEAVYKTLKIFNPRKIIVLLGAQGGGRDTRKRPELSKIAARYADYIILTNEDPYDENPFSILEDIEKGFSQVPSSKFPAYAEASTGRQVPSYEKILDRREAIKKALNLAQAGDIVILTGKGGEVWMCIGGGKKIPWDDRQVVKEELEKLKIPLVP